MSRMMDGSQERPAGGESPRNRWFSFGGLVAVMNSIGTCWIIVLLVLINSDIIRRTAFDSPVPGVTEIVGMSIVACVFLQLAHALRMGRLTRSDIIMGRLKKHPRLKFILEAIYNLLGALILIILLFYTYPTFIHAWNIGEYEGSAGGFTAPVWPVKFIIVIGCLVAALQCLLNCWNFIKKCKAADSPAACGAP
jgi:TRAP-type mannitol/chloroaromatic compound transport system permease small subunit